MYWHNLADGYHIVKPMPNGYGGYRSMKMALIEAGLSPHKIDHVNCHATSTVVGDTAELFAI